jgi:hypothetical protein
MPDVELASLIVVCLSEYFLPPVDERTVLFLVLSAYCADVSVVGGDASAREHNVTHDDASSFPASLPYQKPK